MIARKGCTGPGSWGRVPCRTMRRQDKQMGEGPCWQWDQEGNGRRPLWLVHGKKWEVVVGGVSRHRPE